MVLINKVKIKKALAVMLVLIQVLILTSCIDFDSRKYADRTVKKIFTSIKNNDKEALESLFCNDIIEDDDFSSDMDNLFRYISGDVLSYEFDGLPGQGMSRQYDDIEIRVYVSFTLYTSTNEYYISFFSYPRNDFDENKVGIERFAIIDAYDWNYSHKYATEKENKGIYIDLGYTKLSVASITDNNREFVNELIGLVERNNICVNEMFINGCLPYEKSNDSGEYALVKSDDFKTLDDIKRFLTITYTENVVESLMNSAYDRPQYKEIDGNLFALVKEGDGNVEQWSDFIFESYARKENCEFTVLAQYQSQDGSSLIVRYKYKAVNINGQWKLEEVVSNYDLVGKGYIEEDGVMIVGHMEGEKLNENIG